VHGLLPKTSTVQHNDGQGHKLPDYGFEEHEASRVLSLLGGKFFREDLCRVCDRPRGDLRHASVVCAAGNNGAANPAQKNGASLHQS
jgi:hypothetical protein